MGGARDLAHSSCPVVSGVIRRWRLFFTGSGGGPSGGVGSWVVCGWGVLAVLVVAAAAVAPAGAEEGLFMPGAESQKAFDLLDERQ